MFFAKCRNISLQWGTVFSRQIRRQFIQFRLDCCLFSLTEFISPLWLQQTISEVLTSFVIVARKLNCLKDKPDVLLPKVLALTAQFGSDD
jgi:hypothetical protein